MKLLSLYIENFGCLSGYELHFDEGITTINRPNGFGKTTLAEFIRAMFYGFPRKTKTLEKSKRQKYTPWNGGSFGGNLVFEQDGQRYRQDPAVEGPVPDIPFEKCRVHACQCIMDRDPCQCYISIELCKL